MTDNYSESSDAGGREDQDAGSREGPVVAGHSHAPLPSAPPQSRTDAGVFVPHMLVSLLMVRCTSDAGLRPKTDVQAVSVRAGEPPGWTPVGQGEFALGARGR